MCIYFIYIFMFIQIKFCYYYLYTNILAVYNLKQKCVGSVQDGSITGGGVFRDEVGRFILGYSIFFGDGSNNRAEF